MNSQPAVSEPLQAFLEMGMCGNPGRSKEDPMRGTIESSYWWALGLDGCLFFIEIQLPTLADFFAITHLTGRRDPEFTGLLGQASSQDPWE